MSDHLAGNLQVIRDTEVEWVRKMISAWGGFSDAPDGLETPRSTREAAGRIVDRYAPMIEICAKQKMMADPQRSGDD